MLLLLQGSVFEFLFLPVEGIRQSSIVIFFLLQVLLLRGELLFSISILFYLRFEVLKHLFLFFFGSFSVLIDLTCVSLILFQQFFVRFLFVILEKSHYFGQLLFSWPCLLAQMAYRVLLLLNLNIFFNQELLLMLRRLLQLLVTQRQQPELILLSVHRYLILLYHGIRLENLVSHPKHLFILILPLRFIIFTF